jgi:hypothetical protein
MTKYRKNFAKYILSNYSEKIKVYLPAASVKSANYDKFRDVGYHTHQQNYITVKAWIRDTTSNELIVRQLGIVATGAKKLVIKNNDIPLFKLASRITIADIDFYVFNDAVGNKMQILNLDDNYCEITVFKKDI